MNFRHHDPLTLSHQGSSGLLIDLIPYLTVLFLLPTTTVCKDFLTERSVVSILGGEFDSILSPVC